MAERPSTGANSNRVRASPASSTCKVANLVSSTSTMTTTAIGPLRGSFMMAKVRSRSPMPPIQASAVSANPSRCKPPVSNTQITRTRAASTPESISQRAVCNPASSVPMSKPIAGKNSTDSPSSSGFGCVADEGTGSRVSNCRARIKARGIMPPGHCETRVEAQHLDRETNVSD